MNKTTIIVAVVVLGAAGYVAYRLLGAKAAPMPASTIAPEITIVPPAPPAPLPNVMTTAGFAASSASLVNNRKQPPIGLTVLPRERIRPITSRL